MRECRTNQMRRNSRSVDPIRERRFEGKMSRGRARETDRPFMGLHVGTVERVGEDETADRIAWMQLRQSWCYVELNWRYKYRAAHGRGRAEVQKAAL